MTIVQGAVGNIKYYEKRKVVKDFVAIYRDGKLEKIKTFPSESTEKGYGVYILPRKIVNLEDIEFDQCSSCEAYFPDGLDECEHCNEKFCCDCADEHRDEIADDFSTGGCRF